MFSIGVCSLRGAALQGFDQQGAVPQLGEGFSKFWYDGTKNLPPTAGFHGHELLILVKMRALGKKQ